MRVMRRLYRLLLLSLHEHRQDEREREEASQPGEGEGEKAVLGYAAVRALSNLVQGGGIPPGELLQTGVDALCRRASPPPPAALVARASGSEAEEVTRWEGASRKLCVRALSNLASTTAEQAQEHARSKGLEREPPTIAPRRKPPKSGWVLQKETGKVVFRKEEQVRVRESRVKDMMLIAGLPRPVFWLTYLVTHMLLMLASATVGVLVMAAFGMAGPSQNPAGVVVLGYLLLFACFAPAGIFFGYLLSFTTNSLEVVELAIGELLDARHPVET